MRQILGLTNSTQLMDCKNRTEGTLVIQQENINGTEKERTIQLDLARMRSTSGGHGISERKARYWRSAKQAMMQELLTRRIRLI